MMPRRNGTGMVAFVCIVVLLPLVPLAGQEHATPSPFVPLAPSLPVSNTPLEDLLLLSPNRTQPVRGSVELRRYGQAGRPEEPRALDLPQDVQALELHAWDWIRPVERPLELVVRRPYYPWLLVQPDTHVVVLSETQVEFSYGRIDWIARDPEVAGRQVSAGTVQIRGRGTARLLRPNPPEMSIAVSTGRFEVVQDGRLVAVLGAGQNREVAVAPAPIALEELVRTMGEPLGTALEALRSTGTVDGATLAGLWEVTREVLPRYAAAEERRESGLAAPEALAREIGEALRFLAAFGFVPPNAAGM